ncbi:MAG: glycosyltransferase family 9 protein [Bacteroidales bacterium]|nr:glycosyltransferase family 9 protein [Bacteroidales bacterium]
MKKILIIQTAFLGDVVLATPVIENLRIKYPEARIDFLLRKGNESLFENSPRIDTLLIWDKKKNKYKNLFKIIRKIRKTRYNRVINLQRFFSTGFITWLSGAREKAGFDKNPFSFCYTLKVKHEIGNNIHEVERNLKLITDIADPISIRPVLYPSKGQFDNIKPYQNGPYICIAPTSVWFTKQYPPEKWNELIRQLDQKYTVYLLGSKADYIACENLKNLSTRENLINLSGALNLPESAALMKDAAMNYVNDSAPLHLASAVNAKTTAIFCSTVPEFGFGPLSDNKKIVQVNYPLECRPCGLHGLKKCPENHFKCAMDISTSDLLFEE